MNKPNKNLRNILIAFIIFVCGAFVGMAARDTLLKIKPKRDASGYVERREGQHNYINPLLACDVADDVISNPDIIPFKAKIEHFLETNIDKRWATKVGVYYRELNDGYWFSIGDTEKFIPASMRKVPLMIALLKQAETSPGLLERLVTFDLSNDYNLNQNFKPSTTMVFGIKYSVRDLIYRMIVYSDNNAFTVLTKIVDPAQLDKVYSNLRLLNPRSIKDDEFLSVQTYESFFRILYNASYVSRESSEWALEILSKSEFKTGLVSGVSPAVKVSHKFGEKSDASDGTVQLHDCGIVYYPRHPYLLCVMSKGPNFELLDDVIAEISRITFTEVDRQHRSHWSRKIEENRGIIKSRSDLLTEETTMNPSWKIETIAVQGGYEPKSGEPRILPIIQSTTFKYDSAEHVTKLFDLEAAGFFYTRLANPTTDGFETKIAQMEGGVGAMATSSGQAATTLAILNICQAGQHIVTASTLYGGTYNLFAVTLPKMGIEVTFIDPEASAAEIKKTFKPNTRCLFAETIGNPVLNVLDFEKFAAIANEMQAPLIIDNTFGTPFLCRPFEHGAHIVIHSATKYIDGHATSVGGVIVDGGTFNWGCGRFPELVEPDESYHGLEYVKTFGPLAYIIKARVQLMRDLGTTPAPLNSFLFNLGLETLHLRMQRHSDNALAVARFLETHPLVSWVCYPGLASHPTHDRALKYLPKGCSGVLTFGIKGGAEAGRKFMEATRLVALVVHVGDARSCVLHPASTTHRQLSAEQQQSSGVKPDLIRLSIGIEDAGDIIADIDQALHVSQK